MIVYDLIDIFYWYKNIIMKLKNSKERNREFIKISQKRFCEIILWKNPLIIDVGANKRQSIVFLEKFFHYQEFLPLNQQNFHTYLKKYNKKKYSHK